MAVVAVTADVARIAEAKIAVDTGAWGNDGGGGGIADEADVVYQNDTAQSRKVGTTPIGRDYTHGAGTDMDGTPANRAHCIVKISATNYAILLVRSSPALHMKIGSGSGDHHWYYLFGNDNYPPKGGFQIIAIAPSVTGYQDGTDVGTPVDSSILYWSILGDFATTSKAENVIIDAIDVGLGLGLIGGDGGDADGVFQDFVDLDEGTVINRWGFVYTEGGVLFIIGQLAIGQTGDTKTSTLTVFQDSGKTLVWNNGLVRTGFHRLLIDLATAGTDIDLVNCSLNSLGQINNDGDRGYTTTEDSRTILQVIGAAAATFDLTACVINNFASLDLLIGCTLTNCVITNCGQINAGTGAVLNGTSISGYTGAADSSSLIWNVALDSDGDLDDMTFVKGTNAHHAVELGLSSPLTMTFRGLTSSGFNAADGQNDSFFHVKRTTGDVTINIIDGTGNFKYKSDGANVTIVISPVTTEITVKDPDDDEVQDARVLVEAGDGTGDLPFEDSVTITSVGTTASVSHTGHDMANGDKIVIRGANEQDYNGVFAISNVATDSYDYTMGGDPSSPATGTITATGVVVSGLTSVLGIVSASKSFSVDQNVKGVVRKSSATPFYRLIDFTDTVDKDTGLTKSVQFVLDE